MLIFVNDLAMFLCHHELSRRRCIRRDEMHISKGNSYVTPEMPDIAEQGSVAKSVLHMARSTRSRGTGGKDPNQLNIDWTAGNAGPRSTASPPDASAEARPPIANDQPPVVQRLPWDFKTTFPQPLPEAIEAGMVSDEDAEPENIRAIHEEHAREMFAALLALDVMLDARRRGVDPETGHAPATQAGHERLQTLFATEPARLERWWQTLLDTYETTFGAEAADAFGKAIRARQAGIEVIGPSTVTAPAQARAALEATADRLFAERVSRKDERRRIVARLPVPRPLPSAVAAGRFGQEEDGRNVGPGPNEVRAITEQFAETLIDLLQTREYEAFGNGLAKYAEDFGQHAADQLEAYTWRQARERSR